MAETKLHRPHVGMIEFTFWQRVLLLLHGRLYFATRKATEVTWSVAKPREIRAGK